MNKKNDFHSIQFQRYFNGINGGCNDGADRFGDFGDHVNVGGIFLFGVFFRDSIQ